MAKLAAWESLIAGTDCPLCLPRPIYTGYHYFVRRMTVSSLYLSRDQTYRGASTLVYDPRHVVRIDQFSSQEWQQFATDIQVAESAVYRVFKPDHVNVESLGNTVPHLHFHILPRYKVDGRWGRPIWMTHRGEMPERRLADSEYAELASLINVAIDHAV